MTGRQMTEGKSAQGENMTWMITGTKGNMNSNKYIIWDLEGKLVYKIG